MNANADPHAKGIHLYPGYDAAPGMTDTEIRSSSPTELQDTEFSSFSYVALASVASYIRSMSSSKESICGYLIGKAKNGALWVMRRPHRARPRSKPPQRSRGKSDKFLHTVWVKVRQQYFPNRPDIDEYVVAWSTRSQLRTLASCSMERKRVVVARELNNPEVFKWLEPLLYHEMCHAYLGMDVSKAGGKFQWHGKEFKALERRHPMIKSFDAWVKEGGWHTAIRSDRARRAHAARKLQVDDPDMSLASS